MGRKGSDYVPEAEIPKDLLARYEVTLSAVYGAISVTEGAKRLKMSRVRFQTLMHRAQRAFAEALMQKPAGRPAKSEREAALERELSAKDREIKALQKQLAMAENLFGAAGEMMRSLRQRRQTTTKAKAATRSPEPEDPEDPEDPEPARPAKGEGSRSWRRRSHSWLRALRRVIEMPGPRRPRRPRRRAISVEEQSCVEELVGETHGLIGAEALSRATGVSRRQAAAAKRAVLARAERRRKARCGRVIVNEPGLVRGFDAMHVMTTEGRRYLLVCADGAVPYRTTLRVVPIYDGPAVAATLREDMERHGAPLAYRFDRAACHRVEEVQRLLAQHGVVVLQGPPHHPGYYGQLERQNREHRAWLDALGIPTPTELLAATARMKHALNALWPRRTLDWQSAEGVWKQRPQITVDRHALRREVDATAARLAPVLPQAERVATERVLTHYGFLHVQSEGWR